VFSGSLCFYSSKQNKYYRYLNLGSQDGVVSIVSRLWSGFQILAGGKGIFSFPRSPDWLGPTQSPIQWPPRLSLPGITWEGHDADRSSPSGAEVNRMSGSIAPLPLYAFIATWTTLSLPVN
jgi:hypothetical protein